MTEQQVGNGLVSFTLDADQRGVRIRDELEHKKLDIETDTAVSLQQVTPDRFVFPVDAAVSVSVTELRVPSHTSVFLRDETGEHLGEFSEDTREVPFGTYFLELTGATKTYVRLPQTSFTGELSEADGYRFSFDSEIAVDIGARSLHRHPRATMTVPDDPNAVLEAVSMLGSSIKEFSSERSWPTLRGHPPTIEHGEELAIPDELAVPDTGITITVPPTYADAFRVAPLAFYLGATVEPGTERALHLDIGYTEPLGETGQELEASVDELLARCLLLDSLTRVGGYYSMPRAEYDDIAAHLPFYPPNLYDSSIAEQLMEYLEVEMSVLEPYLPEWPMTATLRPRVADAPLVPLLLDTLVRVHVSEDGSSRRSEARVSPAAVASRTHGNPPGGEAWLTDSALEHGLATPVPPTDQARIQFVAASESCTAGLREFSARRADLVAAGAGEIDVSGAPSRAELRALLASDLDFLYFGGRTTDRGFVCTDGVLPIETVQEVGTRLFAFGGQSRVDGALRLVEAGATAGLVAESTLDDRTVGRFVGYLLASYSLNTSATLAGLDVPYRYAGDPTRFLVRRFGGQVASLVEVTSVSEDEHRFTLQNQLSHRDRLGGVALNRDDYAQDVYQLHGARVEHPHRLSTPEVLEILRDDDVAVRLNGTVHHRNDADAETVRRSARRALEGKN